MIKVMTKPILLTICIVAMIVVIIGVDVLIFRNYFWERLLVNVGIVLVCAAFCFRFLY